MKTGGLKWTPAVPIKKPDNIVSSRARENGESGFTPTYASEARENMNFIMSHEYMRIWFNERKLYELDTYSKFDVEAGSADIKRRFIQRRMKKKNTEVMGNSLPPIKLKRFSNIKHKIDNTNPNIKKPTTDAA